MARRTASALGFTDNFYRAMINVDMNSNSVGATADLAILGEKLIRSSRQIDKDLVQLQTPCAAKDLSHHASFPNENTLT